MKKINSFLFKSVMSKFITGVTIITINKNNKYIGKTVNSFASISLNPPLVLFSLGKKSSFVKNYAKSSFFGINILSKKQKRLSIYFSKIKPHFPFSIWNFEFSIFHFTWQTILKNGCDFKTVERTWKTVCNDHAGL